MTDEPPRVCPRGIEYSPPVGSDGYEGEVAI